MTDTRRPTTTDQTVDLEDLPATATTESMWIIGLGAALLALGLVMTFSASFVRSTLDSGGQNAFAVVTRQAIWAAVGLPLTVLAARMDYRRLRPMATPAVLITLVGLVLVLIVGREISGARRWFELGPVNVQPAEIIKLTLPLYTAHLVAQRWSRIRRGDLPALFVPALPIVVIAAALVAISPDIESALLVALIGMTPLFIAGMPLRLVALASAGLAGFGYMAIQGEAYRLGRIEAWLDPTNEAFRSTYGYQSTQGFVALGNGGIFGQGLGQGRGQWLYVPNAHTDFIYAIIGEELGLVGGMAVLLAFALLAMWGCRVALTAADPFGRLLAAGLTVWLTVQAAINISSVVGVLPVTGVTLPLISAGGSSLVVTMVGVGLLIGIARRIPETTDSAWRDVAGPAPRPGRAPR